MLLTASSARPAAGCLRPARDAQPLSSLQPAIAAGAPHQALRRSAAAARRRRSPVPTQAILDWFKRAAPQQADTAAQQQEQQRQAAVGRLLAAIEGSERGLATQTQPAAAADIMAAVDELAELGEGSATTEDETLSATWKLLWTTEKVGKSRGLWGRQLQAPPANCA